MIGFSRDDDGIVTLTMDDPSQGANTMNAAYVAAMGSALDRLLAERDTVTGVILTSAKNTFFAGGDVPLMSRATRADAPELFALLTRIKHDLRRLETLGRPVVAAINGAALGGGLEIALACHHRIALDAPGTRIGFPEVTLGLLPGAGGVSRTVRMLGPVPALTTWLLSGRRFRPADAVEHGLVDEVAATPSEMLAKAREWIAAHPDAAQPWDRPGHRIPGLAQLPAHLPVMSATLRAQLKGASLPAPEAILATAVEGLQVDFATAQRIETRHLITLITGQIAKNMMGALFFDMKAVNGGLARPAVTVAPARRVAVIGAGMMGAGIALACARAGLDVVIHDVAPEAAARAAASHPGITAASDIPDVSGCDVVIEAVFEDPALKQAVFRSLKPVLAPDALLASNTSTLPISSLGDGAPDFLGMHFFSPVAKMPLLEIVVGAGTSDAAVARAFDLGRRIGKTPIVVRDGRGFFTSRVVGTFIDEAIGMLAEGVPAASIEQAALQAGYPTGPLALADEVSLELIRRIRRQYEAASPSFRRLPSHDVVDAMLDDHGRSGRAGGGGFFAYANGKRTGLWPGLARWTTDRGRAVPFADLRDRLLFAEALDARRCLDEGVLRTEADGNVGSILGIGFPAWTGGVLRFAAQHEDFPGRAAELASRYGSRFAA
nr:3-hydroxyacyl-CoA dehydrogenase NAD-binding domain-containing protein [uncultured Actinoplanes sp.]